MVMDLKLSDVSILKKDLWIPEEIQVFNPKSELGKYIKSVLKYLPAEQASELIRRVSASLIIESSLYARLFRDGRLIHDYGLVGRKVITDAGVNYLVDQFQAIAGKDMEKFKYHGLGTGVTAEATSQTALVTELTTQYNPDNVRATGSQVEGATANIYKTVATNSFDAAATISEHGLFDQAAVGGGSMWDRTLFASTSGVGAGDTLETTYQLTCNAGG